MLKNKFKLIVEFFKRKFGTPEAFCGFGSYTENTKDAVEFITRCIKQQGVTGILDVGCGDLNWLKNINLEHLGVKSYLGIDFDKDMIFEAQKQTLGSSIYKFEHVDVRLVQSIKPVGLIICRDLFIHLETDEVNRLLTIFASSGSHWLVTNNYPDVRENTSLQANTPYTKRSRKSRKLNLFLPPYNMKLACDSIYEVNCGNRQLVLWDLRR